MRNQRGEVVTGIMVVMMAVMMLGGMRMLHGEHRAEGEHAQIEHRHSQDAGMQHVHDNVDEQAAVPVHLEDR